MSGLLKVFSLLEATLPERDCIGRACCCQLEEMDHEPFVTVAEIQAIQAELKRQGRNIPPPRKDGACPLLAPDDKRCSIYAARPVGCRTYFCREAGGTVPARQLRDALHALNTLDEALPKGAQGSRPMRAALEDARKGKSRANR